MPLFLRLPAYIEDRLDRLAVSTGRTKTFYAMEAIREHLDELEDYYEAEAVKTRIDDDLERTIPLSQILADYGLKN